MRMLLPAAACAAAALHCRAAAAAAARTVRMVMPALLGAAVCVAFPATAAAAAAAAAPRYKVTLHPDVDNIFGDSQAWLGGWGDTSFGLNRTQAWAQRAGDAHALGTVGTIEECQDACLTKFPTSCFSFTLYKPTGQCYAVTTSYWDWWPGLNQGKGIVSGRVWHGCSADTDCANNGECVVPTGTCRCRSGWKGSGCTELDLQPTPRDAGYQHQVDGANASSWGGAPHKGDDGLYHMFVSQMTRHCGIIAWGENSIVVHTVSESMVGPFR